MTSDPSHPEAPSEAPPAAQTRSFVVDGREVMRVHWTAMSAAQQSVVTLESSPGDSDSPPGSATVVLTLGKPPSRVVINGSEPREGTRIATLSLKHEHTTMSSGAAILWANLPLDLSDFFAGNVGFVDVAQAPGAADTPKGDRPAPQSAIPWACLPPAGADGSSESGEA